MRPLTVGEIFDRAVTLVVRRWRPAAVIALLASVPNTLSAALIAADPLVVRHTGGGTVLLTTAGGLLYVYAFAALAMLFGREDDGANGLTLLGTAFASFWRLFRVSLATGILIAVAVGAGALVVTLASAVGGSIGAGVAILLVALAIVPVFFAMELALCDAAIEGTGATISIGNAFRRAFPRGGRVRTILLAYAATLCYFVPSMVIGGAFGMLAIGMRERWIAVAAQPLETVGTLVFFAALTTVAAIDYRVRAEGSDIEASLDVPETA